MSELPKEDGWYHVRYGDGAIGLLEVRAGLVIGISKRSVRVENANWNDDRDARIVEWGPRISLCWK